MLNEVKHLGCAHVDVHEILHKLRKIICHAERSEASRMRPRGCTRDPSRPFRMTMEGLHVYILKIIRENLR